MKKIIWIGIVILLGLLLLSFFRERFEATPSIKAPPYDGPEKARIFEMALQRSTRAPFTFLGYQDTLMNKAKQQNPNETDNEKLKELAGGLVSPTIAAFFTEVYKPATVPITEQQIDTFLATRSSDIKDIEKQILKTYFIDQGGVGTGMSSGYAEELARMGQNYGYMPPNAPGSSETGGPTGETGETGGTTSGPTGGPTGGTGGTAGATGATGGTGGTSQQPTCPTGLILIEDMGYCGHSWSGDRVADAICPPNTTLRVENGISKCYPNTITSGSTSTTGSGVTPASVRKSNVLGPLFTSYGAPLDGSGADSYKSNQYPELLGGGDPAYRSRVSGGAGGGIGSLAGMDLKGAMPSMGGLGATEESRFFPTSRQPGDMELIPDPYRVSQQFSSASYSFKTEPTPFLTDFSAFFR